MRIVIALLTLLALLAFLSSAWLTRPVVQGQLTRQTFEDMMLAPKEQALTLATTRNGSILLVSNVNAQGIEGIDIQAATGQQFTDSIAAYAALGHSGLQQLHEAGTAAAFKWSELGLPVPQGRDDQSPIAAGTNYRAHAREVGLEEKPFLFPKLSRATPWDAAVLPGARLDYEVELCAVLLSRHSASLSAELGYTLCGDYTDRWLLVRDIDLDGPMGRTGFPLAKGGASRLPLGPLLLIPLDDNVYQQLELSLYLDETLRQSASAGDMIWSPRDILNHALQDCDPHYHTEQESVALGDCDSIPAGTLLLTGTPGGVMFQLGTLWNPWAYLEEGEVVTSFGTYLGYMQNEIATD